MVYRSLLSIPTDLNNAVVWIVSICPPISNSYNPRSKSLGTIPSAPTTTGITVTFMFHNFHSFLARSSYLSLFSLSLIFSLWSVGTAKSIIRQVLFNYYYYYYYFTPSEFFYTSVSWWSFTGVRVTANLLRSPGLFSVFYSIIAILMVTILHLISNSFRVFFTKPLGLFQAIQLQVVSSSPSCSIDFFLFSVPSIFRSFLFLAFSLCVPLIWQNPSNCLFIYQFLLINSSSVFFFFCFCFCFFAGICISKSWRILCVSFSQTDSCLCTYSGQILISCTIPTG